MTDLGVRFFTAVSAAIGAVWGLLTVGTPFGVVLGTAVAAFVGWMCASAMRVPS